MLCYHERAIDFSDLTLHVVSAPLIECGRSSIFSSSASTSVLIWGFRIYLGDRKNFNEHVSDVTNKRLDDALQDCLPSSYRKHNIFFVGGNYVGPAVASAQHADLSINWCLGDKDIEVVDSTTGLIIDG